MDLFWERQRQGKTMYASLDLPDHAREIIQRVADSGPRRVMTSPDVAVNPRRSPHYKWAWIFIRADGWSLGVDLHHLYWGHKSWADEWRWVLVKEVTGAVSVLTIEDWREAFAKGDL